MSAYGQDAHKAAADFEAAMARIVATFEGSGDELDKLRRQMTAGYGQVSSDMAKAYGTTLDEAAEAIRSAWMTEPKYVIPETFCPVCEGVFEGYESRVCLSCDRDMRDED